MYNNHSDFNDENNLYHYSYRDSSQQPPQEPVQDLKPHKEKKPAPRWAKITAIVLAGAIVSGACGYGGAMLANHASYGSTTITQSSRTASAVTVKKVDGQTAMSPAEVYASTVNSVVSINCSSTSTNIFGQSTESASSGSGFIITSDGYIVTNHHVISGASKISVTLHNGDTYDATVIGSDSDYDVAVLKVDAKDLTPVTLGDSTNVNVGDTVLAVGNPLGELTFSLTSGMVSALNREVTFSNGLRMSLIQTDAAINSGNSGGALFNMYGEVVGITNAKYGSSSSSSGTASIDNIGFAIPIDDVRSIVESIIENGYIVKPYIGVSVQNVSSESQQLGLPQGAAVAQVVASSPAESAGLKANDIITAVNGTAITSSTDLVNTVKGAAIGDELTLSVYRQGQEMELKLTVGEKTQDALPQTDSTQSSQDNSQQQQQQPQDGQQYGYSFGQGGFPFSFFG